MTLLLLSMLACKGCKDEGGDTGDVAWRPDVVCPGDAGCETADGELMAGAASVVITFPCFETWDDLDDNAQYSSSHDVFYDCGCDKLCEGDDGWPGADEGEGDGQFQGAWIAGFGTGRAARSVHDDQLANAVALRKGDTTVALVSLDVVGFFNNDVDKARQLIADAGVDVDYVIVGSTHTHEAPDTLGQWGKKLGDAGHQTEYNIFIEEKIAQVVTEAVGNLEPATLTAGAVDSSTYDDKGTWNTVRDSRNPTVIQELVFAARLADSDGDTIATMVNWGNHPEVLSSENLEITSDFSHYLRKGMEEGFEYDSRSEPGYGGVCVYVQGMVGGLMTPLGITVTDFDGVDHEGDTWEKSEALGHMIAGMAIDAIEGGQVADDPNLAVRAQKVYFPIENFGFQAMYLMGVFEREAYNFDPEADLTDYNVPELLSEVDYLELGPIRMVSAPGELFPEIAIGGYDGTHVNTDDREFISSDNPNPPDMDAAPAGPYLTERMGGEYNWIIGLGNDELGYMVPPYDWQVDDLAPYIEQADGDHYEETNSTGPEIVPIFEETVDMLIEWSP